MVLNGLNPPQRFSAVFAVLICISNLQH